MRSRRLPGLPVLTLDNATNVGRVKEPLIDGERRRVAALLITTRRGFGKRLLPTEAVHAFGGHAVTIASQEALRPLKSAGELEPLLHGKRIPLLGTPVVTRTGEWAGTVRDYEIRGNGAIESVCVTNGLWRSLSGQEGIIPAELIIAIGFDAVIVNEEALTLVQRAGSDKDPEE